MYVRAASEVAAKFRKRMDFVAKKSLKNMRETQDRELEEFSFITERTVMGSGRSRNTFRGAVGRILPDNRLNVHFNSNP